MTYEEYKALPKLVKIIDVDGEEIKGFKYPASQDKE